MVKVNERKYGLKVVNGSKGLKDICGGLWLKFLTTMKQLQNMQWNSFTEYVFIHESIKFAYLKMVTSL